MIVLINSINSLKFTSATKNIETEVLKITSLDIQDTYSIECTTDESSVEICHLILNYSATLYLFYFQPRF